MEKVLLLTSDVSQVQFSIVTTQQFLPPDFIRRYISITAAQGNCTNSKKEFWEKWRIFQVKDVTDTALTVKIISLYNHSGLLWFSWYTHGIYLPHCETVSLYKHYPPVPVPPTEMWPKSKEISMSVYVWSPDFWLRSHNSFTLDEQTSDVCRRYYSVRRKTKYRSHKNAKTMDR
jgi:hypothetical protein